MSVLGLLLFVLFTADWFSIVASNMFSHDDYSTLLAVVRSPIYRRDIEHIPDWCVGYSVKLNPANDYQSLPNTIARTLVS